MAPPSETLSTAGLSLAKCRRSRRSFAISRSRSPNFASPAGTAVAVPPRRASCTIAHYDQRVSESHSGVGPSPVAQKATLAVTTDLTFVDLIPWR